MRNLLLQYPNLFEPLEPIAVVAIPTIDGWGQPTNEPLRFPQKLTLENYKAEILEPTLFIIPEIDSWFRSTSQPVYLRKPLIPEGFSVGILEPTLFVIPDFDWYQQTNSA